MTVKNIQYHFHRYLSYDMYLTGAFHRHVQTHESVGRPEDYGRDEESGWFWRVAAGQLYR